VSVQTRATYRLRCDCCEAGTAWSGRGEAWVRERALGDGWQVTDIGGCRADVCRSCSAPEHARSPARTPTTSTPGR
jgi:hypothetical protein